MIEFDIMLSLIICSRTPKIHPKLEDNIQSTIGLEFELIVIDNSKNDYSIFSAYNEGVSRSKYPYLCFMHEDILYHTKDWGKNIVDHFRNDKVGLVGVVGSHFMPNTPCGWNTQKVSCNIIQRIHTADGYKTEHWDKRNYMNDSLSAEVVVVDGVWFCIRKSLFPSISFDEKLFKGFHCYDMDICLQVRKIGSSVVVVSDVLLEHISEGSFNDDWIRDTNKLHEKWKDFLPQIADILMSEEEIIERTESVTNIFRLKEEIMRIRNSKAFRLGRFILQPIKNIKNK